MRRALVILTIVAAGGMGVARAEDVGKLTEKVVKELGPAPPEQCREVKASRYGDGVWFIEMLGGAERMLHNGKAEESYRRIEGGVISPDGSRLWYFAVPAKGALNDGGEKYTVVCDGKVIETEGQLMAGVEFSPDGQHVAYGMEDGGVCRVMRDGIEVGRYKGWVKVQFAPDSQSLIVEVNSEQGSYMVIDGVEGPRHEQLIPPERQVWREGKTRYVAGDKGRLRVVEVEWPPADPTVEEKARAEKLIRRLGEKDFKVREEATKGLVGTGPVVLGMVREAEARTDDPEVKERCERVAKETRFAEKVVRELDKPPRGFPAEMSYWATPSGEDVVYWVNENERGHFVAGGREQREYERIQATVAFSTEGRHFAHIAEEKGKQCMVVDGEEGERYDEISEWDPNFTFSEDGSRFAYCARRGTEWFLVVDGKELGPYGRAYRPIFAPDGKHLSYTVQEGNGWRLICDGLAGRSYEFVSLSGFSPDGKHLYYVGRRGNEWFMVCDGKEGPARKTPFADWQMVEQRAGCGLRYLAIDEGKVRLVEVEWPEGVDWGNGMTPLQ